MTPGRGTSLLCSGMCACRCFKCLEHSASVYWVIFGFCFLGHLFSEALEIVSLLFQLSYFPALMVCIPLLVTGLAFVLHCVLKDSIIKAFLLFLEFL